MLLYYNTHTYTHTSIIGKDNYIEEMQFTKIKDLYPTTLSSQRTGNSGENSLPARIEKATEASQTVNWDATRQ